MSITVCTIWRGNSPICGDIIGACALEFHELAPAFSILFTKYIFYLFRHWHRVLVDGYICNIFARDLNPAQSCQKATNKIYIFARHLECHRQACVLAGEETRLLVVIYIGACVLEIHELASASSVLFYKNIYFIYFGSTDNLALCRRCM